MLLFHSRTLFFSLLPLLTGNISASAFDIPVKLSSGPKVYLSLDESHIDFVQVINDPEEQMKRDN